MPIPRVFISSTCYDLADERDNLSSFCSGFGFDVALSERGDVFYHPDLHTHTSCVREIETCQLFVLIMGGRFGGKYISDKTQSITNAEYSAARELGVPIFAFVKQDVLNDHNIWQRNMDKSFANQIHYPSIDKQEHALDIFTFIDQVRLAPTNNGFFGFKVTRDICEFLRKQWAGLMFEYLQTRSLTRQLSTTNETLVSLTAASNKIEEIVRNIYHYVDAGGATKSLTAIDLDSRARELFLAIAVRTGDKLFLNSRAPALKPLPAEWTGFLTQYGFFTVKEVVEEGTARSFFLQYMDGSSVVKIGGTLNKLEQLENAYFAEGYEAFLQLPDETRTKILREFAYVPEAKVEKTVGETE